MCTVTFTAYEVRYYCQNYFVCTRLTNHTSGYLLLGVLPPKVKDYNAMYGAIFRHLQKQDSFSGFPVEDAAEDVVEERNIKLFVNNLIEDVDGIPHPTCCKHNGSENGSCPFCKTLCKKVNGRPCYIGAAHYLRLIQFVSFSYT